MTQDLFSVGHQKIILTGRLKMSDYSSLNVLSHGAPKFYTYYSILNMFSEILYNILRGFIIRSCGEASVLGTNLQAPKPTDL